VATVSTFHAKVKFRESLLSEALLNSREFSAASVHAEQRHIPLVDALVDLGLDFRAACVRRAGTRDRNAIGRSFRSGAEWARPQASASMAILSTCSSLIS